MIRVAVYTSGSIMAGGVRAALQGNEEIELSGTFSALDDLELYLRSEPLNVVLLEVTPQLDLKRLSAIVTIRPETKTVLWFDNVSEPFLRQGLAAGAQGLLSRNSSLETFLECLREVAHGTVWLDRSAINHLFCRKTVHLAPRERQLLGLVAQGLSNKEIAWSLSIAEGTVKVYLHRLFHKLNVSDRFELAFVALKNTLANQSSLTSLPRSANGEKVAPLYMPIEVCLEATPGTADAAALSRYTVA